MPRKPLRVRELLARLKPYGVKVLPKSRGKGSEIILIKPVGEDPAKGPQIPVKNHGEGTELSIPVIKSVLRRFGIPEDEFWD